MNYYKFSRKLILLSCVIPTAAMEQSSPAIQNTLAEPDPNLVQALPVRSLKNLAATVYARQLIKELPDKNCSDTTLTEFLEKQRYHWLPGELCEYVRNIVGWEYVLEEKDCKWEAPKNPFVDSDPDIRQVISSPSGRYFFGYKQNSGTHVLLDDTSLSNKIRTEWQFDQQFRSALFYFFSDDELFCFTKKKLYITSRQYLDEYGEQGLVELFHLHSGDGHAQITAVHRLGNSTALVLIERGDNTTFCIFDKKNAKWTFSAMICDRYMSNIAINPCSNTFAAELCNKGSCSIAFYKYSNGFLEKAKHSLVIPMSRSFIFSPHGNALACGFNDVSRIGVKIFDCSGEGPIFLKEILVGGSWINARIEWKDGVVFVGSNQKIHHAIAFKTAQKKLLERYEKILFS